MRKFARNGQLTVPVITIDGPSGSGKGTIGVRLAALLGFHFLDSGALYRATAWAALQAGVGADSPQALSEIARHLDVNFDGDQILLAGEDINSEVRNEKAGALASEVAAIPAVRGALFERQQAFIEPPGLVADGRDMGTVVFPHATAKFFLTASADERALRRYNQLIAKGESVSLRALVEEISLRDERDSTREISPLRPAADAIVIDSSNMTIDQVLDEVHRQAIIRLG